MTPPTAEDRLRRDIASSVVMARGVATALALLLASYSALLYACGDRLWSLETYDTAKTMPGGITTWATAAAAAALLIVLGIAAARPLLTQLGAAIGAAWVCFLAVSFAGDALEDGNPAALTGTAAYGCWALVAVLVAVVTHQ